MSSSITSQTTNRSGLIYGFLCYFSWGLFPIYWKYLKAVPSSEILAHRVLWSLAFTASLITLTRSWQSVTGPLKNRKNILLLFCSATLIAINWLLYIWAVNTGKILEASLAYFMTPIVNIGLGVLWLKEKLRLTQKLALGLGILSVAVLTYHLGNLPLLSLGMSLTFALYGAIRKKVVLESLAGLTAETALLSPLALLYVYYLIGIGQNNFGELGSNIDALLMISGVITSLPLIWFAKAARALPLSTLGLFQYIAPSGQFLLAIFVYGETCTHAQLIAFFLIWIGLAAVSIDGLKSLRTATQ